MLPCGITRPWSVNTLRPGDRCMSDVSKSNKTTRGGNQNRMSSLVWVLICHLFSIGSSAGGGYKANFLRSVIFQIFQYSGKARNVTLKFQNLVHFCAPFFTNHVYFTPHDRPPLLKGHHLGWPLKRGSTVLSKHTLAIESHIYIWQVSPQLSCGGTCQI